MVSATCGGKAMIILVDLGHDCLRQHVVAWKRWSARPRHSSSWLFLQAFVVDGDLPHGLGDPAHLDSGVWFLVSGVGVQHPDESYPDMILAGVEDVPSTGDHEHLGSCMITVSTAQAGHGTSYMLGVVPGGFCPSPEHTVQHIFGASTSPS